LGAFRNVRSVSAVGIETMVKKCFLCHRLPTNVPKVNTMVVSTRIILDFLSSSSDYCLLIFFSGNCPHRVLCFPISDLKANILSSFILARTFSAKARQDECSLGKNGRFRPLCFPFYQGGIKVKELSKGPIIKTGINE